MNKMYGWLLSSTALLLAGGTAHADLFIVKPTAAKASSEYTTESRYATNSISGSGLAFDLVTGNTIPSTYPSHTNAPNNTSWRSALNDTNALSTFDLGTNYVLTGFHLWNYNESSPNNTCGISNAVVLVSQYGPLGGQQQYTVATLTVSAFAKSSGNSDYTGENYTFTQPVTGRFVRIACAANWGSPATGLSEIRFIASATAPSPPSPFADCFIVKPTAAQASSENNSSRRATNSITGSGLAFDLMTGNVVPAPSLYPSHTNTPDTTSWLSAVGTPSPTNTFDLGANYALRGFHMWNYNESSPNNTCGISNAVVLVSQNGPINGQYQYTVAPLTASMFYKASGNNDDQGEDYTFTQPVTGRFVRIACVTNWGSPATGMSEIRFMANAIIPSPFEGCFIIKPTWAQASSEWTAQSRYATNAIDGSGLSSSLATGNAIPLIYPGHVNTPPNNNMWLTPSGTSATNTFDLGAKYSLSGFHLWNYNESGGYDSCGVSNAVVSVSQNGPIGGGSQQYTVVPMTGSMFFKASGASGDQGNDYTFTQPVVARYVRIACLNNFGGARIGMSEIRFIGKLPPRGTLIRVY